MTNLRIRTITGLFFVTAILLGILVSPLTFLFLFFVITLSTVVEFYRITTTDSLRPQHAFGTFICMLLFSFIAYVAQDAFKFGFSTDLEILFKMPVIMLAMVYLLFFAELFRGREKPFLNIGLTLLGIFYIALPFGLFCMIGLNQHGGVYDPQMAVGLLVILWVNDSGAYLVGSKFGKRKLFERISPRKTLEGTLGGLALAIVAAGVLSRYYHSLGLVEWITWSVVIAVAATLGDLVASMLKRSYQLKDSGKIFPGHGGFLDRFDGLLGAAPFAYLFLYLIGKV